MPEVRAVGCYLDDEREERRRVSARALPHGVRGELLELEEAEGLLSSFLIQAGVGGMRRAGGAADEASSRRVRLP